MTHINEAHLKFYFKIKSTFVFKPVCAWEEICPWDYWGETDFLKISDGDSCSNQSDCRGRVVKAPSPLLLRFSWGHHCGFLEISLVSAFSLSP